MPGKHWKLHLNRMTTDTKYGYKFLMHKVSNKNVSALAFTTIRVFLQMLCIKYLFHLSNNWILYFSNFRKAEYWAVLDEITELFNIKHPFPHRPQKSVNYNKTIIIFEWTKMPTRSLCSKRTNQNETSFCSLHIWWTSRAYK